MEAYISDATIARCRAMLNGLPPRTQSISSWKSERNHPQLTQLTLLPHQDRGTLESSVEPYSLVNA